MPIPRQMRNMQAYLRRIIRNRGYRGPTLAYRVITVDGDAGDFLGIRKPQEVLGTPVEIPGALNLSSQPSLAYDGLRSGHARGTVTFSTVLLSDVPQWLEDVNRQAGDPDPASLLGIPDKARNWLIYLKGQLGTQEGQERTELLCREAGWWRRIVALDNVTYDPGADALVASVEMGSPFVMTLPAEPEFDEPTQSGPA